MQTLFRSSTSTSQHMFFQKNIYINENNNYGGGMQRTSPGTL
jgi:hypothetical protein